MAAIATRPVVWNGQEIRVGVTYGAYSFRGGDDPSKVLEEADRAMYARKPNLSRRAS